MSSIIELFREEHNLHFNDMSGGDYDNQYIEWLEKKFDESNPKTGLEEKLTEILNGDEHRIRKYENQVSNLAYQLEFYSSHNLTEERRIAALKHDAMFMVVDRLRGLHTEIKDALSAWLS